MDSVLLNSVNDMCEFLLDYQAGFIKADGTITEKGITQAMEAENEPND